MQKWIFGLFALLLVVTTAIYVNCFIKNGSFAGAAGFDPLQAGRVTVCTEAGQTAVITDREDILSLVDCLSHYRYIRDDRPPGCTDVLYTFVFYNGNRRLADIAVGNCPVINGVRYRVTGSFDGARIRQIVDRYLPGG